MSVPPQKPSNWVFKIAACHGHFPSGDSLPPEKFFKNQNQNFTHFTYRLNSLVYRALGGAGMRLHTSMLGTFFVYTLALSMHFFLKIGILSAKVYTKNALNKKVCKLTPAPLRALSTQQMAILELFKCIIKDHF